MSIALDSWAVLRLLEDTEPAASRVDEVLEQQRPVMSWINLGEQHAFAYADAFAVATANAHQAVLLTGDPELLLSEVPWESGHCPRSLVAVRIPHQEGLVGESNVRGLRHHVRGWC